MKRTELFKTPDVQVWRSIAYLWVVRSSFYVQYALNGIVMKHHSKMCDLICECVMPLYVPGRDKENVATMEGEKWINQSFCLLIIQKHFGTYLGWSIIIPMSLTYTPGGRFCSHALEVLINFQRIMNRRGTFCYNLVIWSNLCI